MQRTVALQQVFLYNYTGHRKYTAVSVFLLVVTMSVAAAEVRDRSAMLEKIDAVGI